MAVSQQELKGLILVPRENLDTELKQWVDPATPEAIGKIARACIALRNNNGGCLIVGFNDDGTPDSAPPFDVSLG